MSIAILQALRDAVNCGNYSYAQAAAFELATAVRADGVEELLRAGAVETLVLSAASIARTRPDAAVAAVEALESLALDEAGARAVFSGGGVLLCGIVRRAAETDSGEAGLNSLGAAAAAAVAAIAGHSSTCTGVALGAQKGLISGLVHLLRCGEGRCCVAAAAALDALAVDSRTCSSIAAAGGVEALASAVRNDCSNTASAPVEMQRSAFSALAKLSVAQDAALAAARVGVIPAALRHLRAVRRRNSFDEGSCSAAALGAAVAEPAAACLWRLAAPFLLDYSGAAEELAAACCSGEHSRLVRFRCALALALALGAPDGPARRKPREKSEPLACAEAGLVRYLSTVCLHDEARERTPPSATAPFAPPPRRLRLLRGLPSGPALLLPPCPFLASRHRQRSAPRKHLAVSLSGLSEALRSARQALPGLSSCPWTAANITQLCQIQDNCPSESVRGVAEFALTQFLSSSSSTPRTMRMAANAAAASTSSRCMGTVNALSAASLREQEYNRCLAANSLGVMQVVSGLLAAYTFISIGQASHSIMLGKPIILPPQTHSHAIHPATGAVIPLSSLPAADVEAVARARFVAKIVLNLPVVLTMIFLTLVPSSRDRYLKHSFWLTPLLTSIEYVGDIWVPVGVCLIRTGLLLQAHVTRDLLSIFCELCVRWQGHMTIHYMVTNYLCRWVPTILSVAPLLMRIRGSLPGAERWAASPVWAHDCPTQAIQIAVLVPFCLLMAYFLLAKRKSKDKAMREYLRQHRLHQRDLGEAAIMRKVA